jgi:hypothetical protein
VGLVQFAETQEALVQTVVQGMSITFALSFAVLLFATGNLILALLSIVTIAGIVTSVLGIGCRLIQVSVPQQRIALDHQSGPVRAHR